MVTAGEPGPLNDVARNVLTSEDHQALMNAMSEASGVVIELLLPPSTAQRLKDQARRNKSTIVETLGRALAIAEAMDSYARDGKRLEAVSETERLRVSIDPKPDSQSREAAEIAAGDNGLLAAWSGHLPERELSAQLLLRFWAADASWSVGVDQSSIYARDGLPVFRREWPKKGQGAPE